jgi:hypothetical protein
VQPMSCSWNYSTVDQSKVVHLCEDSSRVRPGNEVFQGVRVVTVAASHRLAEIHVEQ